MKNTMTNRVKVERFSENNVAVSSADGQWVVRIDKQGFRDFRMVFLHDSSDTPLNVKHVYCMGIGIAEAKYFINNPE